MKTNQIFEVTYFQVIEVSKLLVYRHKGEQKNKNDKKTNLN